MTELKIFIIYLFGLSLETNFSWFGLKNGETGDILQESLRLWGDLGFNEFFCSLLSGVDDATGFDFDFLKMDDIDEFGVLVGTWRADEFSDAVLVDVSSSDGEESFLTNDPRK